MNDELLIIPMAIVLIYFIFMIVYLGTGKPYSGISMWDLSFEQYMERKKFVEKQSNKLTLILIIVCVIAFVFSMIVLKY